MRDSLGAIHWFSHRQVFFANSFCASEAFCAVTKVSITWQKPLCGVKGHCQFCFASPFLFLNLVFQLLLFMKNKGYAKDVSKVLLKSWKNYIFRSWKHVFFPKKTPSLRGSKIFTLFLCLTYSPKTIHSFVNCFFWFSIQKLISSRTNC